MILFPPNVMQMLKQHARSNPPKFLIPSVVNFGDGCNNCGGEGVVHVQWVVKGPLNYIVTSDKRTCTYYEREPEGWYEVKTTAYPCPVCRPASDVAAAQITGTGLHPEEMAALDLDWFEAQPGKRQVAQRTRGIMRAEKPTGLFVYFGEYGTGKSSLLKLIVSHYSARGLRARYTRAEDILTELRASFGDDGEGNESEIKRALGGYDVLAIDEVDRISDTGWARATMMTILDERYRVREWKATILATNKAPSAMGQDMAYLSSRIKDGQAVPVGGGDLRGVKR